MKVTKACLFTVELFLLEGSLLEAFCLFLYLGK